jgi:hypothetical protein
MHRAFAAAVAGIAIGLAVFAAPAAAVPRDLFDADKLGGGLNGKGVL